MKDLLDKTPILASLQVQSTKRDAAGVFVRIHSAAVLEASSDWNETSVQSAIAGFIKPGLTASQLGVGWLQRSGYQQLDGLWPLAVSVRGKYLIVSDDSALMESLLANFARKADRSPSEYFAGFSHDRERGNFVRFTGLVDRPSAGMSNGSGSDRQPQFFSGNIASLSTTLAGVSGERMEVHGEGGKVRQTVTYEWSQ